jgi:hypothetical protein
VVEEPVGLWIKLALLLGVLPHLGMGGMVGEVAVRTLDLATVLMEREVVVDQLAHPAH